MNIEEIKKHWESLAATFKEDIHATTKTKTIKFLEIDALFQKIKSISNSADKKISILEVGCGNGHNIIGLKKLLPSAVFTGVDYVSEMIEGAKLLFQAEKLSTDNLYVGDVSKLTDIPELSESFDIVFTVRCLINLPSIQLQREGFQQLVRKTAKNGHIIGIENFTSSYTRQNELRRYLGLSERVPDKYNLFIDEEQFLSYANELGLKLCSIEDFASLHDILLYVLIPFTNGGRVDYEHSLMSAVTDLLIKSDGKLKDAFGSFGQNRLYHFIKE